MVMLQIITADTLLRFNVHTCMRLPATLHLIVLLSDREPLNIIAQALLSNVKYSNSS